MSKDNEDLNAAIQRGIAAAKEKMAADGRKRQAAEQKRRGELARAFAHAAGLIEGLTILRDLPGSKFTFTSLEQGNKVCISTNIPRGGRDSKEPLDIVVSPTGEMRIVSGDDKRTDRTPHACARIIEHITEKAVIKGLIPA